jgi:thiol-disulfide isomerase/thioredoxin
MTGITSAFSREFPMSFPRVCAIGLAMCLPAIGLAQSPDQLKLPEGVTIDALADAKEAARVADVLDQQYPKPQSEAARMLIAILRGSQLNGTDGWFGPSQSRYSWNWLAARSGVDATKAITLKEFTGPQGLFTQLDRDGDGRITAGDLDWSDRSPYVMQANLYSRFFRRMDGNGDGKLTKEEFDMAFQMLSRNGDSFTADQFRRMMIPRGTGSFSAGDAPTTPMLVKALFGNEIGSMTEGPNLGDAAPDFTLKSADGKKDVTLSKLFGEKPTVLCFGNFTCGPFRSLYPDVDAVYSRFKDKANFVMVYVREAHPTDGWKMDSNARFGVKAVQPKTYEERVGVCTQFEKLIKPGMSVVVDDITDPVGKAYSGMPARLYIIDPQGKVAYKGGRGPFGFKPSEMEQALVMSLVEAATPKAAMAPSVNSSPVLSNVIVDPYCPTPQRRVFFPGRVRR